MKRFFCITALAIGATTLSSCNTWIGFTRDLQMAGRSMENKAESVTHGTNNQSQGYKYAAPQQPRY